MAAHRPRSPIMSRTASESFHLDCSEVATGLFRVRGTKMERPQVNRTHTARRRRITPRSAEWSRIRVDHDPAPPPRVIGLEDSPDEQNPELALACASVLPSSAARPLRHSLAVEPTDRTVASTPGVAPSPVATPSLDTKRQCHGGQHVGGRFAVAVDGEVSRRAGRTTRSRRPAAPPMARCSSSASSTTPSRILALTPNGSRRLDPRSATCDRARRDPKRNRYRACPETIAGLPATYIELTFPASLPCEPGEFCWQESAIAQWWPINVNEHLRVWIIEVQGQRVAIAARSWPGTSGAAKAELEEILDTIVFQGASPARRDQGCGAADDRGSAATSSRQLRAGRSWRARAPCRRTTPRRRGRPFPGRVRRPRRPAIAQAVRLAGILIHR